MIGALLQFRDTHHAVLPMLNADCFYDSSNATVFKAINALYKTNRAVDTTTVADELHRHDELNEVGGAYRLVEYTRRVASSLNTEYHAVVLVEKYLRRQMITIGMDYYQRSHDESTDTLELLDSMQRAVIALGNISASRAIHDMRDVTQRVVELSQHAKDHPNELLGITTGFADVDHVTNGWKSPDLVIIAGRPAMGKTSFAVQCALNAQVPVGIFSLEMSKEQINRKMLAMLGSITTHDIEAGNIDERLTRAQQELDKLRLYVNDKPALTSLEIRTSARKMVKDYGCRLIIIDYLQLIAGSGRRGQNRENEVSEISRNLKAVAKELDVCVIALSQLSRKCEDRSDKRPMLSDLRESGAIEQDADMVVFLYRPEYYGEETDDDGESVAGLAEVIVAKHRNGEIGRIDLTFEAEFTRFTNRVKELAW